MPVVVCWGEDDTWVPLERGRELAARIPVRTCGSSRAPATSSPRTTPAELTAALVEFLHDLP